MKKLPSWNAWIWDFNENKLKPYDVVPQLYAEFKAIKKSKRPIAKEEFAEILKDNCIYHFWSKCEYEMEVSSLFYSKKGKEAEKVDVYDQLKMNWDVFVDWFWTNVYSGNLI